MASFLCRNQLYWLFCIILLLYCIIPVLSQQDDANCNLPLIETDNEEYMSGCGLFCDSNEVATPWTDRAANKNISILFLAFLIPAFICNLIFTSNNISEHRENEETFDTTPITYDALFVIDVAYLVVIICLLIPHFSYFDGGNTVSSTYICNYNESTLSIGNPTNGSNGLCTFFGLLIFTGFKIILIYTGILCVNIWYRLWKPMVDVGIKKKWLHGSAFIIVFIFDIFILGFGGIDANPSNGMCYLSMNDVGLLLMLDIIPNILFIIISTICVVHATKQLRLELNVIQQAELISDDLLNLIHRMNGFLIMAVLSSAFIVFTELIWWICAALYNESTKEWIHCTQSKVITEYDTKWKYKIGDQCISELKEDGYSFPNEMFFIAFPIAALFSNIAIIILTCHRRQSDRWIRGALYVKNISKSIKNKCLPKKPEPDRIKNRFSDKPLNEEKQESTDNKPSVVALKGNPSDVAMSKLPSHPSSDEEDEENEENEPIPTDTHISTSSKPNLSVKVYHTPQNSGDVEQIDSIQYHPNGPDAKTMSFDATPTGKSTDTPTGLPSLADDNTMIRHPTPHDDKLLDDGDMDEFQRQLSLQKALENAGDNVGDNNNIKKQLSLHEQTEMLIKLDKSKSETASDRLEHIANASFDYHNLTQQGKKGVPLPKILGLEKIDSADIAVNEDDINKSKQLNARLHSLQMSTSGSYSDDNTPKSNGQRRDSQRSKTLPTFPKRSSTQRRFVEFLDEALDDEKKKDELKKQHKSKSTKSVKFADDTTTPPLTPQSNTIDDDADHLVAKTAANVILRTATDSLVRRVNDEDDIKKQEAKKQRLKKVKTSIDATNAVKLDLSNIGLDDNSPESINGDEPDIGDRRLSHQQRQQQHLEQVTLRQKKGFFDKWGKRKKNINKLSKSIKNRWKLSLKSAKEFKTSAGISIYTPSSAGLLKPVTMESQYNIDTDYFDEDTETTYSSQKSFESTDDEYNELDILLNGQKQTMQWQSNNNIFHFTLCDDDFKSMLHSTFTPHSTRKVKRMTFDINDPYAQNNQNDAIIIKEDEETETETITPMSKLGAMATQSMNDLKCDQSVSGIGSDGKIVLSDMNRFKNSRSVPLENDNNDKNMMLSEDEEYEYDVKYDDDDLIKKIKPNKSKVPPPKVPKSSNPHHPHHQRTGTLHGRLLDAVPHSDRKDLIINIHQDFSCEVVEKGRHFKAETAKLAFTLKPVHSMKILM